MRRALIMALALLLVSSAAAAALASNYSRSRSIQVTFRNVKIAVDGQEIDTENEPFIFEGRTYLPARPLAEALGARVEWDDASNSVLVYSPNFSQISELENSFRYRHLAGGFEVSYPKTYTRIEPGLAGAVLTLQKNGVSFSVNPSQKTVTDLEEWTNFNVMIMESLFSGFRITGRKAIQAYGTEAVEVEGEFQSGETVDITRTRFFVKNGRAWMISASCRQDVYTDIKAELDSLFAGFVTLPKKP